jgi:hypothetical protein
MTYLTVIVSLVQKRGICNSQIDQKTDHDSVINRNSTMMMNGMVKVTLKEKAPALLRGKYDSFFGRFQHPRRGMATTAICSHGRLKAASPAFLVNR